MVSVRAVPMKMPLKAPRAPKTSNNKVQKVVAVKTKATKKSVPAAATGFRMQRNRVQTTLYQSPATMVRQVAKTSVVTKKTKTTMVKKVVKGKKTAVAPAIPKVKKMTKKEAAREKAKQVARKGNDRLKKRDGITIKKENPFFVDGAAPDFVSVSTYHRWLIRALVRKNVNELKTLFKNKKFNAASFEKVFSYADNRSPDGLVCLTGDVKLIQEYYKLKDSVVKEKKPVQAEPNMLQRKATGQKNFYMLGRATRQLHMSRGGREGNNAFLDYEGGTDREDSAGIEALVEANTPYQDIHKICNLQEAGMQTHWLSTHLVTACRRGHTELAHAIASSEAQHCTNDLVRVSLKVGGKLPAKILPVSVVKKVFANKNITPLHTAAINPDGAKMLEQMRAVEPNINVADQDGWYTVHYASVCRNAEPLRYLLKNGAVPSMLNKKHQSPLHVAAIAGRSETVKVLMEAIDKLEKTDGGEDPKPEKSLLNARTRNGMTPLLLAVRHGHVDVVKTLLENSKVLVDCPSSAGSNKITPLMLASAKGNLEMAQLLVSKDALVEAKDKKKRTPLIHAVLNGQEHTAAYLLSMGCDLLKGDSSGNKAAHYAAAYGWLQCLQLLADVDPDCLEAENDWKLTPLTVAFLKGHYGIVSWLLDGEHKDRVNINGKDMEGYTLLSCLLTFSDPEVHHQLPEQIEYLLKRGADCTLMDSLDNTILHDFAGLQAQIATASRPGMTEKQYLECFMKLCDRAPDAVTAKNQEGLTPLHVSLMRCNLKVFNWFLEKIKDPKEFFTSTWSSQKNFLETLLRFPMESWTSGNWDSEVKPSSDLYDVLPIIKNIIMKYCKAEVENWMREKDPQGNYHILEFAKSYQLLAKRPKSPHFKNFIAYMTTVFSWICDVFPEALTLQAEASEGGQRGSTLFNSVISGPSDPDNVLLLSLLKKAVEYNLLGKVLRQDVLDVPLSILALRSNTATLKAILDFSAKNKCTDGVHNAVLKKVKEGDVEKDVNKTLLMLIIEQNEFDLVRDLVLSPEEWKAKDADGNSAWHVAAKSNHHRTMVLMKNLEAKKVPREANNRGATPLHVAVQACDGSANSVMEPIEWLVTKSNVADQDHFGRTAMHYAFASFVELEEKRYGATPKDPIAVVSILAMGITEQQLNISDVDGNTALHLAAAAGANICAVTLLRKGSKVDVKNSDGNTPLALAVLNARQGVALTLIQANSCVTDKVVLSNNKKEEKEVEWVWKALVEEVEKVEDSSIPAQIVKRGTDWAAMVYVLLDTLGKNTKSLAQITVCALKERQYNLANQLLKSLEALLDGKALEFEEDLVLTFAQFLPGGTTMSPETVERTVLDRLLALGCPLLKDGACPAFEVALKHSAWRLVFELKERMGAAWGKLKPVKEDEGPLHALLTGGNLKQEAYAYWLQYLMGLKQLKATTVSLSLPTPGVVAGHVEGKYTALGWAALSANIPLIELLRKNKFDINAADEHGRTPLMLAVLSNDGETVEAICCDVAAAGPTKHAPLKKAQNGVRTTTNFSKHLAFTNARKRKADDSDEEEEEDEDNEESEEESGSGSGSEEDEEENNNDPKKQPLAKRFKIANKQLSLEVKDNSGRNLFHYLCEPISWENVEMFKLIAREQKAVAKKLLLEKDNFGVSPQPLAVVRQMRQLASAMAQVSGQTVNIPAADLPSVKGFATKYDITADSKAFMEKFAAENDKKNGAKAAEMDKPCNLSGYKDSGIVEKCAETGQYFRVLLNKSDLSYGRYGFHNFYRMELIKRRDADLWNLFTNWGRIGDNTGTGEFQSTPFGSLEAGIKEFKSVFKSKAGQEWLKLENFVDLPKKYRLVKIDTSPSSLTEVELPPYPKETEKDAVRGFVKDISDPKKLKEYQSNVYRRLNISCPFGRITQEAIDKAREILDDCRLVSKQMTEAIEAKGTPNTERLVRLINQANDLSSEFYSVIPMGNAEFSALTRLDSDQSIENAVVTLNRMSEVEIATRILTAAARHPEVDRINYVQSSIECGLRAMRPDEEISQNILQWIHNTGDNLPKGSVKGILEVTPMRSIEAFTKFANEDYHKFLFHGTRAANLVSLMRDGFVVDPHNANINGRLFGDGIYLADCFDKSNSYCEVSARGWKYMLICQVAMGKTAVRDINKYEEENLTKSNVDVLHMEGRTRPRNCTVDGVVMPLGKPKKNKEQYWFGQYSEYIVRDPKRVLPRFIVMYE